MIVKSQIGARDTRPIAVLALRIPLRCNSDRSLDKDTVQRPYGAAIRKHFCLERSLTKSELGGERRFEEGTQVECRPQVALFVERAMGKAWPIRDHTSAPHGATDNESGSSCPVIRSA